MRIFSSLSGALAITAAVSVAPAPAAASTAGGPGDLLLVHATVLHGGGPRKCAGARTPTRSVI
jgi:hypothetical protein